MPFKIRTFLYLASFFTGIFFIILSPIAFFYPSFLLKILTEVIKEIFDIAKLDKELNERMKQIPVVEKMHNDGTYVNKYSISTFYSTNLMDDQIIHNN